MPPFCPSLKSRTVLKKTCKCCLIQDCLSLVLVHPCQGANSNKVSNAARAAMRMWGTRPETLQENARDRSRHTTLISCHVASHRNLWETLHIIFMNLLFHSVTAWFLCKTWPFQTCISASTIHLFYFCLQVIGSTAICPFQLPIKSHSANSSYKEEKWFIRFQTTNVEIDKMNNEANKKNAIERKITLILPCQESNGSSMVGTQGLSRAVCENSCLTDVNELFVHKSTGKSVPKGMQRTPIRAHDPCYPNWSAGNMGTSHALCKEQAVTTRRLRKGCTSRIGKAGHLGVGHGCA